MKKSIITLSIVVAVIAMFASCSKSDTKAVTPTGGSFTVDNVTCNSYVCADSATTTFFGLTGNIMVALGANSNQTGRAEMFLFFKNGRPAAGTYNVGGNHNYMGANQVLVLTIDSTGPKQGIYGNDSVTSVSVTITSANGKLTATLPPIRLSGLTTTIGVTDTSFADTVTASGSFTEN